MCRNGFYPLAIAPIVTATWVLDVYGSLGCNFIHVDIGMDPINIAWNQTTMDLGLFHYRKAELGEGDSYIMNSIHPGCSQYESVFDEYFVEGDKTWQMAKIMAMVSGCAGAVATAVVWLMCITPLPSCFVWPGILLPSTLLMLLAGTAKFLFFDTEICRSALWVPSGEDSTAQKVESCQLSKDSIISIVTSVLSLLCVLLICLRAPTRRKLDENYGMRYLDIDDDTEGLRAQTMEDSTCDSPTFEDLEEQGNDTWNPPQNDVNRAYNLDDICHKPNAAFYKTASKPSSKKSSTRTRVSKRTAKISNSRNTEAEEMRAVEASMDHADSHLKSVWNESGMDRQRSRSEITEKISPRNARNEIPQLPTATYSEPLKQKRFAYTPKKRSAYSPSAPSDESAFGFRSPLKAFKENFSPRKSSSTKKKNKIGLEDDVKKYDEEIIDKCLNDLESSFSN